MYSHTQARAKIPPMSTPIKEALHDLNQAAQNSEDEAYKALNTVEFDSADTCDIKDAEARLGLTLPPSYKNFVAEHGTFRIGASPEYAHMGFRLLELSEVQRLHGLMEEEHEVSTSAEIADNLGVEEDHVAATKHGVVFAVQGSEDFYVFDERSQDVSNECKVVGVLLEDEELAYFAEQDDYSDDPGFEAFVLRLIASRKSGDFD